MYVTRKARGMGDLQTAAFPFVGDCQVGGVDPATGDTIAGCLGGTPAPLATAAQSVTVTAKAYPNWLYVGAAVVGSVLLLKLVKS